MDHSAAAYRARLVGLRQRLRSIERRLGTSHEASDDFERVVGIAHEINNVITAIGLRQFVELNEFPEPATVRKWAMRCDPGKVQTSGVGR